MQSTLPRTETAVNQNLHQRGFVLVTAMVFLMVLSLLGVMAVRGSLFEERLAANDRDTSLARENAELALRDAERDVLGLRFDGQYCSGICTLQRVAGTRPVNSVEAGNFWIAANENAIDVPLDDGGRTQAINSQGIYSALSTTACGMPVWSGADWVDGVGRTCTGSINATVPTIPYGTFTDAPFAQQNTPRPRYLIEMFTSDDLRIGGGGANKLFFRITAVGFGRTTGSNGARTSVTLQSVFSPL